MAVKWVDALGHENVDLNGTALTASTTGTTVAGTIVPVAAGAGTGSAVSGVTANDRRGSFGLTAAGSPAAGAVANVFFNWPYPAAPAAVVCNIVDTTDSTAPITCGVGNVSAAGFTIYAAALTTAKAYTVNYVVTP